MEKRMCLMCALSNPWIVSAKLSYSLGNICLNTQIYRIDLSLISKSKYGQKCVGFICSMNFHFHTIVLDSNRSLLVRILYASNV